MYKGFALERNYEAIAIKKIELKALKRGAGQEVKASIDHEIEAFCKIKDQLSHPNVLAIYDVLQTTNNLYIVMEYCRHGDLSQLMKKKKHLTEDESVNLLTQLVDGLG